MAVVCISFELLETNINQLSELASLVAQRMFLRLRASGADRCCYGCYGYLCWRCYFLRRCVCDKVLPGSNLQCSNHEEFAGTMSAFQVAKPQDGRCRGAGI